MHGTYHYERYCKEIPESWNMSEIEQLSNRISIKEYEKRIAGICGDIKQFKLPIHFDQYSFECLFDSVFTGRVLFFVFSDASIGEESYPVLTTIVEENMNIINAHGSVFSLMGYKFSDLYQNIPYFSANQVTKMKLNIFEIVIQLDIKSSFERIEKRLHERHLDAKKNVLGENAMFFDFQNYKDHT